MTTNEALLLLDDPYIQGIAVVCVAIFAFGLAELVPLWRENRRLKAEERAEQARIDSQVAYWTTLKGQFQTEETRRLARARADQLRRATDHKEQA